MTGAKAGDDVEMKQDNSEETEGRSKASTASSGPYTTPGKSKRKNDPSESVDNILQRLAINDAKIDDYINVQQNVNVDVHAQLTSLKSRVTNLEFVNSVLTSAEPGGGYGDDDDGVYDDGNNGCNGRSSGGGFGDGGDVSPYSPLKPIGGGGGRPSMTSENSSGSSYASDNQTGNFREAGTGVVTLKNVKSYKKV
jgi:hypothetical protein